MRIIDYTVTVRPQHRLVQVETFRLATSLLDHRLAPARQLAQLYHQRCRIENGFAELRNRLRGAGFILRSKTPELICEEIYALLTVYQALSALKVHAAEQGEVDPDRISFTTTVQLARLKTAGQAAASPQILRAARLEVVQELLNDRLPPRRDRRCQRLKKPPRNTSNPNAGMNRALPAASATHSMSGGTQDTYPHLRKHPKSPALLGRGTFCSPDHLLDSPLRENTRLMLVEVAPSPGSRLCPGGPFALL
ncbi:transposase [Streptomyces sp. NPDC051658]|uniref:transposase n=1 Tax=Streptomyces sp. NPDC051658 TaxID=3365667 RepID=UPI00379DDF9E